MFACLIPVFMVVCQHDLWRKFMLVLFIGHGRDWCRVKTLLKSFDATLLDSCECHLHYCDFKHFLNIISFIFGHSTKQISQKLRHVLNWLFPTQAARALRALLILQSQTICECNTRFHCVHLIGRSWRNMKNKPKQHPHTLPCNPPTLIGVDYQWTVSTSTGCNQWFSLTKPILKLTPASGIVHWWPTPVSVGGPLDALTLR